MFTGLENESDMYQASAKVSTLLLKLGEVSRKFQPTYPKLDTDLAKDFSFEITDLEKETNKNDDLDSHIIMKEKDAIVINNEDVTVESDYVSILSDKNNPSINQTWYISFEQLIASLLNDDLLVNYFDAKFNLSKKLFEYKSNHG